MRSILVLSPLFVFSSVLFSDRGGLVLQPRPIARGTNVGVGAENWDQELRTEN